MNMQKFDYGAYTTLNDLPTPDFYKDGQINHQLDAPVTIAGTASCSPNLTIPVKVTNFVDIGAISLTMDYDNTIVQVSNIVPNNNLLTTGSFTADWTTTPGRIIMGWIGSSGLTLPDNSVLMDITFTGMVDGATDLVWVDNGISCEYAKYAGGSFIVLNDSPTADFYKNGHISYLRASPITVAPLYTSVPGQNICIPIKVYQFTDIGAISLTLDYDPSVLTLPSIEPVNIPGDWSFSGQAFNAGRLIVGGLGPGFSLNDGDVLFKACFHYNGGTSTLKWWDGNGIASEYADAATLTPLCDQPQSAFYIDGLVTETLTADFMANNLTPTRTATVHFTDLSTGGATSWEWSFNRTRGLYEWYNLSVAKSGCKIPCWRPLYCDTYYS